MSTTQQIHSNGFSPTLLSPNSTSNTTITNNHLLLFDNSDQGSVDSDYTSLGSSKFYGNGGSTSSLHRQGRSQSIDELASSTTTTTIPTRHFNGISNVNKVNNDPLQFVKIHPNHDLIERAQEQLNLLESRKRLHENLKLNNNNNHHLHHLDNTNSTKHHDDDDTDWSKAVENWRLKREQKRKQSLSSNRIEDEPTTPTTPASTFQPSPPPTPVKQVDEPKPKPTLPPPPPPPSSTNVLSAPTKTNISTEQLSIPNRKESKSPSPQRIKGSARIHEIFIQKPIEVRGFGFKSDGGAAMNRPIYISYIEDGSPADKAGLCVDDEIIRINDENVEQMTFDQVRKILKERNLRGSIKMLVRTFEDGVDDTSQTVTTGPFTEQIRTPSPQKPLSTTYSNISAPPPPPPPPTITTATTTSTICVSSSTPTNVQSPVYTFLPYTPSPSSNPPLAKSSSQTPTSSLNIFAPKPFRSTASVNLETQNSTEKPANHVEQSSTPNSTKSPSRNVVNSLLSNPTLITSNLADSPPSSANYSKPPPPPPPLTSVESLLHGRSDFDTNNDQLRNDSPIAQVRSSVEKQMNQLQQELLLGFPHTQPLREQQPVNIPIDFTHAAFPPSPSIKSSTSNQYQDSNRPPSNLRANANENIMHYYESNEQQQRPSSSYAKRLPPDLSNQNLTSNERTMNELRVNISSPTAYQQQQRFSIPVDEKLPQQRVSNKQLHSTLNQAPKQSHYEDRSWINDDQRRSIVTSPPPPPTSSSQLSNNNNGRNNPPDRRSASLTPRHQDMPIEKPSSNQLTMFHHSDQSDDARYHRHHHSRANQQQKEFDPSINRHHQSKHRTKSPIRTTINSNNNRVLSVSGKLRCSRCNDELGQGSAMVIESLGLYYHIECFRCFVCNIPLSSSFEGTDVRVRSNRLHCQNCFSDENGAWRSNV